MRRIRITTIAMTSRMWMNPPIVYEVTNPRSQRTIRTIAIVCSILFSPFFAMDWPIENRAARLYPARRRGAAPENGRSATTPTARSHPASSGPHPAARTDSSVGTHAAPVAGRLVRQGQGDRQGGCCQSSFHHLRLRIDVDLLAGIGELEPTGLLGPAPMRRRGACAGRQGTVCCAADTEPGRNLIQSTPDGAANV